MEKREKLRYFLWTLVGILLLIGLSSGYGRLIDPDSVLSYLDIDALGFLNKSGTNANQNIDIGIYSFSANAGNFVDLFLSNLTTGRVVFTTTNGKLIDNSEFLYNSFTNLLTLNKGQLDIIGNAGALGIIAPKVINIIGGKSGGETGGASGTNAPDSSIYLSEGGNADSTGDGGQGSILNIDGNVGGTATGSGNDGPDGLIHIAPLTSRVFFGSESGFNARAVLDAEGVNYFFDGVTRINAMQFKYSGNQNDLSEVNGVNWMTLMEQFRFDVSTEDHAFFAFSDFSIEQANDIDGVTVFTNTATGKHRFSGDEVPGTILTGDLDLTGWIKQDDNDKQFQGTGNDVSHYFNTTDWVFNPNEVGAGDGWLLNDWHITGSLDTTGNITAENVFLPAEIRLGNNNSQAVLVSNEWVNVTFDKVQTEIQRNVLHTWDDETNTTFTILEAGRYFIHYTFSFSDSNSNPDAHIGMRLRKTGNIIVTGSYSEIDTHRQAESVFNAHGFLTDFNEGDKILTQFVSDDTTVSTVLHSTFEEGSIVKLSLYKVGNLP